MSGTVRLRFNLGDGAETVSLGRDLNNGAWHKLGVALVGPRVTLMVDNLRSVTSRIISYICKYV